MIDSSRPTAAASYDVPEERGYRFDNERLAYQVGNQIHGGSIDDAKHAADAWLLAYCARMSSAAVGGAS